jgi:hypothetical protein
MFAVQDSQSNDKFTVDAAGKVNAEGQALAIGGNIIVDGKMASGLSKAPGTVPLTAGAGVFHVASDGNDSSAPAFLAQHTGFPTAPGGSSFFSGTAPNFSFYRINKKDDGTYVLPMAGNALGYFNFGSLNVAQDPNVGGRNNVAAMYVRAESTWSSLSDTPTYFWWASTTTGGAFVERMRLSSAGNLGVGVTTIPTSKLQVVGLPICPDNGTCKASCSLTAGAFYIQGTLGATCFNGTPTNGTLMVAY